MKLATKLAALFVIISSLTVAGVGVLTYQSNRQSVEVTVLTDLTKTTQLKQSELERWLRNNEQLLEARAQRPLVKQYVADLLAFPADSPEYRQAYNALSRDHLPLLLKTGNFLSVSILDPTNGQILIATDTTSEGVFRESEPFFIEGQTHTHTDTPAYSLTDNDVVMHISTPIVDNTGNLIGVMAGHVDLTEMSRIMSQGTELTVSEETYLVNQFGFLVTTSRFELSFPLQMTVRSVGVNECLAGNSQTNLYDDYRGTPVLGSYRWLPELQLCIITEINQSEAFAPIRAIGWQTFWVGLAAVLMASAVGILFSRSLTNPLEQLVIGTDQMAQGSLDHRVTFQRSDELGTLAAAFNQMAGSLKNAQKELSVSEQKYRTLIEGADASISTVTHDGTFLFMNSNAARQLGGKPSDFIGQKMNDLFPPMVAARQLENIRVVIEEGKSKVVEAPSVIAGETHWYNTRLQPVQYSDAETAVAMVIAYDVTSRKEAEQLLNEERDFVNAIMDTAQALIIVLDTKGRIVSFNWACEALTGYTQEEMEGCPFWDFLLLPEERTAIEALFNQMTAGDFPNTYENYWVTKDGDRRVIAWANTCQLHTNGQVKYVIGTGIDITERKQIEVALRELNQTLEHRVVERTEALQESEKRFHRAIVDSPFPIMMHAEDGEVLHLSDSWTDITGYAFAEISTIQAWAEHAYGQKMKATKAYIDQLYGGKEKVKEGEFTITTNSGEQVVWDFSSTPLGHLPDGRRVVMSMAMDVTARNQAVENLRKSEAQFRTAFDYAAIGRALAAPNGRFVRVNSALCGIIGYSENELLQLTWQEVTHPGFFAENARNMEQLAQGLVPSFSLELIIIHKNGDDVWINLNVVLLRDSNNQPLYFAGDVENITPRKWAEAERTRTLKELERSNIELQQFAYVASHDLQEPLRMVTSYLQLLQRRYGSKLDQDADEFIGYAVDGANRMKQLIQDLLTFSRVGTHGKPFESVSLPTILQQVLMNLQNSIEEANACITFDTLPEVTADPSQIAQLLQNLLSNAIKFRNETPPQIHVGVERHEDMWQFSVRDNGIGFDAQFSDRIFIIFQRLHTRANYRGTGIGLAVCKKIAERHGGQIWVESAIGAGTTFFFTLPKDVNHDSTDNQSITD